MDFQSIFTFLSFIFQFTCIFKKLFVILHYQLLLTTKKQTKMKIYTIYYVVAGVTKEWIERSGMGMINTIKFFMQTMNMAIDCIVKVDIENVTEDSLMRFLNSNPSDTEELPKQELSKSEKELVWLADLEATLRIEAEYNGFHL